MLGSLRTITQTWYGRGAMAIMLGFIILSFTIWGIGDIFHGFGSNDLAKVGSTNITADAYRNAYQTELQRLQRQLRRALTNQEARAAGLGGQVLSRLLSDATLDEKAKALGLAISDQQIAKLIVDDDSFKTSGKFDKFKFDALMRENGFTERSFIADQRGVYLRREIADVITNHLQVPKAMLEAINRYQNETRSIDYVVLAASAAGDIAAPSQEQLKSFYKTRLFTYRTQEYRKLVVLALTPSKLASAQQISAEDVQKRYDEVKAQRFTTPEKRTIEQIPYPDIPTAQAARAQIDAGKSFDDLAAEKHLTPKEISLGTMTKDALIDKTIADAAFSLAEGKVSAPLQSQFGTVLLHVSKIDPASEVRLTDVSGVLRQELAVLKTRQEIGHIRDEIEDQRASGKSLTEAAKGAKLEAQVIEAVDALGRDKSGDPVRDLPDGQALLKAAFASDIGLDNDTLSTPEGGTIWFEVAGIDPAHQQSLDEVKPELEKAWKTEETAKSLRAKAEDWVKKIAGGETLAKLAADNQLEIKHQDDVKRSGGSLPPSAITDIFSVPVMSAESAPFGDGRMVFQVLTSTIPPLDEQAPALKSLADQVKTSLTNEVLEQYLAQAQKDMGFSVNARALAAVTGSAAADY